MINTGFQKSLTGLQSKMLNFAYTLTSNRDDAQDLTQDTTLKALTNEKKYATNINFKGWVFTIMRNIFINGYRRKARSGVISETADAPARIDLAQDTSAESPEDVYGAKEITQAINTFPEEYRRPLCDAYCRIQVLRDSREDRLALRHSQVAHIRDTQAFAEATLRLQINSPPSAAACIGVSP